MKQLEIFQQAGYSISRSIACVRRFYLERATMQIQGLFIRASALIFNNVVALLSGPRNLTQFSIESGTIEDRYLADISDTTGGGLDVSPPSSSATNSPATAVQPLRQTKRKRRVARCKMCRFVAGLCHALCRELTILSGFRVQLITRDFMLDHGQVGPPTPRNPSPELPPSTTRATDIQTPTLPDGLQNIASAEVGQNAPAPSPPPILVNSRCSGYFIEPMKWMEHSLRPPSSPAPGPLSGALTCPTPRCRAKLGTFDWAGAKCGCGVWVVPAFCVGRGRVDELVGIV